MFLIWTIEKPRNKIGLHYEKHLELTESRLRPRGSSGTEDRSRSKRNDGGRRAPTTETLFLSTVVSFSRFCHHHRRLIPSSFYSPSPSLVIQLFHLSSSFSLVWFYRLRFNRFASVVNTETKRIIKGDKYFVYTRC